MPAPPDAPPTGTPLPPPPAPPGGRPGPRRLRRRPDDGHIAGVCAGLAEYFAVDPVIVRIAAVVLVFSGPGVFAYALAWIFVPAEPGPIPHGAAQAPIDRKDRATQIFGIVLLAVAISVLWGDWWSPSRHIVFPLGLMALGAWLLLRPDPDDAAVPPPAPVPPAPPVPVDATDADTHTDSSTVTDAVTDTTVLDATTPFDQPVTADAAPWAVPPPPVAAEVPPTPVGPRRRRIVGPLVFGGLLLWAGLAVLLGVEAETGLAGALLIIGVGFVLGSFVGGSRILIVPALLVAAALAATAVLDIPLHGPIGDQRWAPSSVADLDSPYELSVGEGTLDLTNVAVPPGDRVDIDASVGIGHLLILVPADVEVDVMTDVGAGESKVFEIVQHGVGVSTDQSDPGAGDGGTMALDLQVGAGQVEVVRAFRSGDAPEPALR